MDLKRIFISLFCLIGCAYQVLDISGRYFLYSTKQFVSVKIVDEIYIPGVSVCWLLPAVLVTAVEKFNHVLPTNESGLQTMYEILKTYTIEEIFSSSVPIDEIFALDAGCAVKLPGDFTWRTPWYNRSECNDLFTIQRYLHKFMMCYKFIPNTKLGKISIKVNTLSPIKPGIIYSIFLNSKYFVNMTTYTAYGHSRESSALFDSVFSIEKYMSYIYYAGYRIGIISTPMAKQTLPSPYDTRCREIDGYRSGLEFILRQLNLKTMDVMKLAHTLEHVDIPYKFPMLAPSLLRNKTINDQLMSLLNMYDRQNFDTCSFRYNIPDTRLERYNRPSIQVNWSQDNELTTTTMPDQQVIDFLVYVCSSIGIWLGVSIFSFIDAICEKLHRSTNESNIVRDSSHLSDLTSQTDIHRQAICNLLLISKSLMDELKRSKLVSRKLLLKCMGLKNQITELKEIISTL